MCEKIRLHKMPPLNLIIPLFGRFPHYPKNEHGFPKGSPTPWRMGERFSRENWCVSSPLNDSLLLSVRTERREKESKVKETILQSALPTAPFTQGSLFNRSFCILGEMPPCVVRRFFFGTRGAKKKLCKKKREKEISPSADGDKGSAPLTAPPFEKGGRKLTDG